MKHTTLYLIGLLSLAALTACDPNTTTVAAQSQPAAPTTCVVEQMQSLGGLEVDKALTTHCQAMLSQGYRLYPGGSGTFVWVK